MGIPRHGVIPQIVLAAEVVARLKFHRGSLTHVKTCIVLVRNSDAKRAAGKIRRDLCLAVCSAYRPDSDFL